jgi:4-hydroxy-3-polyprenylbenzoate decarboxylase
MMEYQDLRDWIQIADEMGELKTLKGCDWNLEIGAITEIVAHKEDGPAVLFEDIKEYPKGFRVLSNSLSSRKRLALTLGLPSGETKMDFVKIWKENYKKIKPIPPKFVKKKSASSTMFIKTGTSTCSCSRRLSGTTKTAAATSAQAVSDITRDPDEGWVNYGTYRVMIHEKDKLGFYISPVSMDAFNEKIYQASGEPFKIAMSFGHDPLTFLAGSIEVPYGVSRI